MKPESIENSKGVINIIFLILALFFSLLSLQQAFLDASSNEQVSGLGWTSVIFGVICFALIIFKWRFFSLFCRALAALAILIAVFSCFTVLLRAIS
jgi:hypothetical protein